MMEGGGGAELVNQRPFYRGGTPGKLRIHREDCYHTTLLSFRLKKFRGVGLVRIRGQHGVCLCVEEKVSKPVQPEGRSHAAGQ
jgi:hypothetical protein